MPTNYNKKDMTALCSPVTVGDEFKFLFRKCRVTKLLDTSFLYVYLNPTFNNERISHRVITFKYWQENVFYLNRMPILKNEKDRQKYTKKNLYLHIKITTNDNSRN